MYRATSRLPKRVIFTGSFATAAFGLHESKDKLSIYPDPTPDILLLETPSALEKRIGVVRRHVCHAYSDTHARVQGLVSKWIGIENAVENRVKLIVSPEESLTPGLLYVGIATLSGSIIARNRGLPTRLLLPPVLLLASANHFLPKTTGNLSEYLGSIENTYFPTIAQKHDIAIAHSKMTWDRIKEATSNSRAQINRGAIISVEKVQEVTGLKLREMLGWTENAMTTVEKKAAEVVGKEVGGALSAVTQGAEEAKIETNTQPKETTKLV